MQHAILLKLVAQRVKDKRILKLIEKMLKAGIMENGSFQHTEEGASQGSMLGWHHLSLQSELETRFNVPVLLGNDANLAALGEWKFGAGIGHSHLIYVTISTGIGGGIIIDNRLLLGAQGLAGEIGHVTVIPDGPPCGCEATVTWKQLLRERQSPAG